jgi:DNA-binding winged helix-turn-helix (wHTH) protein/TolB-like protein/Tfp pilus assembly protein PilF
MSMSDAKQFYFGSFWLDLEKRRLLYRNQHIPLTRKALDTLGVLVSNAGRVVTREELKRVVWGDAFVEEATIGQNIFTLRKTLGEHQPGQNQIETVAGVGYRFTTKVQAFPEGQTLERGGAAEAPHAESTPKFPARLRWAVVITLLALGLAASSWWRYRSPHTPRIQTLAVLPFANLTGDPGQEYLAEGISDALLTDVAQIPGLRVISGRSAARYAKNDPARKIAQDLRVDGFVEGAVLKTGDRLSVDVRLVETVDDRTVWTARFELSPQDLMGLEYTMSGSLARQLLSPGSERSGAPQPTAGTGNLEAYDEYLKGRFFWNKRTSDDFVKAIAYFNHAIVLDPKYAHAYAGLADTYALLGSLPNATIPRKEAMPKAREAALTALELDESLAEAHTSLAFVKMQYEWDWPGSEKEFKRALELSPNYSTAHQWYAIWLMAQGEPAAALEQERRAQQADPLSMIIKADTIQLLVYAGHCDEAIQQALSALEIDPAFVLVHIYLAEAHVSKQNYPAAISELRKVVDVSKGNTWALSDLARTYALTGQKDKSQAILSDLLDGAKDREDVALEVAKIYAALGENDQAFAWLEKACRNRAGGLILLNPVPDFQTLHHDPRFADLDQRVGLPSSGEL